MAMLWVGVPGWMFSIWQRWRVTARTAFVWRMRPPGPRAWSGWWLPVVLAGMVQKQLGAASRVAMQRLRRAGSVMRASSVLSCVFIGFVCFGGCGVAGLKSRAARCEVVGVLVDEVDEVVADVLAAGGGEGVEGGAVFQVVLCLAVADFGEAVEVECGGAGGGV